MKPPELVAAAIAHGFSEHEARTSPLGVLASEFVVGTDETSQVGARVLMGTNGTVLIELP